MQDRLLLNACIANFTHVQTQTVCVQDMDNSLINVN